MSRIQGELGGKMFKTRILNLVVQPQLHALIRTACSQKVSKCKDYATTWDNLEEVATQILHVIHCRRDLLRLPFAYPRRQKNYTITGFFRDAVIRHLQLILKEELEEIEANQLKEKEKESCGQSSSS